MISSPDGATAAGRSGGGPAAGAGRSQGADRSSAGPVPTEAAPVPAVPATLHDLEEAVHRLEAETEHRPPPAGTTTNVLVAAVVVVLGAAALLGSLALGAGSARAPGTGTFPLLISVLLVALGVGLAATARGTSDAERFSGSSWSVLAGLATMVLFVAVIEVIGFEIPAAVLAFVWLRVLGRESWRSSIVISLGVVVAFYLVFVAALSVPIPHLF